MKASDINGEHRLAPRAVLEREMKVMSAVQARVHAAGFKELKILSELVRTMVQRFTLTKRKAARRSYGLMTG